MRRDLPRSLRIWVAWGTLAGLTLAGSAAAQRAQAPPGLPVPRLLVVSPPGGQVGSRFEVTVAGLDIDEPQALWFSAPGIEAKRIDEPAAPVPEPAKDRNQRRRGMQGGPPKKAVKFQVTIPAGTRVGVHDVRLVNSWGASNPRAFVVGDLAEALEVEPNNDVPQAHRVAMNTTINGTIASPTDVDDYLVACRKGQRVIASALTSSIDSRLLVALQLYDATGRMLATNHEYRGQDALIDVTIPDDGDYLLRASSFTYTEGSDEHFYRLSVSTAPWIDAVFPPVVEPGKPTRITVFGRNLPGGTLDPSVTLDGAALETMSATVESPSEPKETRQLSVFDHVAPGSTGIDGFEYRVRNKVGISNAALLTWARAPVVLDGGNNETSGSAQVVEVPCEVVGRIERARDRDWYAFTARKGDVYSIEALGERLGSPLDLYFLLRNSKTGQMIGEFDDDPETLSRAQLYTQSMDPARYRFVAPEDGRYELMVSSRESSIHAGPRHVYRVRIATEQPDFRLVVMPPSGNAPDAFNLRAGGNAEATVFVWRRDGFDGEITLSADGLPKGVECPRQLIARSSKQGTLVLTASADAEPWVGAITVQGEAKIGGETVVREARAATITWPLPQQQQPNVPTISRLDRSLVLAVRDKAPFRLTAGLNEITARHGEKVEVPLKVERGWPDAKVTIQLTAIDLPPGLTVNGGTVSAEKSEAKVVLDIKPNVAPGVYSVVFRGTAQVPFVRDPKTKQKQNVPVIQPSTPVVLTIVPKEVAKVTISSNTVSAKAGRETEFTVRVARQFDFRGEFEVEFDLPASAKGLRIKPVTIAAGKDEARAVVEVDPDAPTGRRYDLVVKARAMFLDKFETTQEAKGTIGVVK